MSYIIAAILSVHGLVHLLYAGQSRKLFELQPGFAWPEGSWAFGKLFGTDLTRTLATIFCVLAAIGFVVGGAGIILKQSWWRPVVMGSAVFSVAIFILFWNGRLERLDNQGGVGLLIDVAILVSLLFLDWPAFDF
jgi:hypothetical protein